ELGDKGRAASEAALLAWARRSLEPRWALAAVAGFALLPYVQIVFMWAYVDLGFAFFFALTCDRLSRRTSGSTPLLGALCGLCMGTKAAGVFAPVLAGAVLVARRASLAPFAAACALLAAPWGARNWAFAGNPFAPFLASMLPTLYWGADNQARYGAELRSYQAAGGAHGGPLTGLFAHPWSATIRNLGVLDRGAGMGAWFLFALPLLLLLDAPAARLPARLALGFFALWLLIPRQVRYLLPVWPAAALASAHAVRALARRGGSSRFVVGALGAMLALHLPMAFARQYVARDPVPVVFGRETVTSYLNRGVPGKPHSLRARDWIAGHLHGRRFLVVSEYGMGMLWGPDAVIQSVFDTPLIERFAREGRDAAQVARKFRQAGVAHVLYGLAGGFSMQPVYEIYHFDEGAAARWRAFWSARAELVHVEADRYLVFGVRGSPRVPARASVYPGLDEQWLGVLDRALWDAGEKGTRGRD
ncbi:MAG: hypothetical protein AAB368_06765, partial [bacterium]